MTNTKKILTKQLEEFPPLTTEEPDANGYWMSPGGGAQLHLKMYNVPSEQESV